MATTLTVTEAASVLGVSRQRVLRLIELGRLAAKSQTSRIGHRYHLIAAASVEAYQASRGPRWDDSAPASRRSGSVQGQEKSTRKKVNNLLSS